MLPIVRMRSVSTVAVRGIAAKSAAPWAASLACAAIASSTIASASSRSAAATLAPSAATSPTAANRASIRSMALRTGAAVGAALRSAFAVPKRIARRANGDERTDRSAVRASPQAASWPSRDAPRTTDSRTACATSAPERQTNSTSSSGIRRWSSSTTCSRSSRNVLRHIPAVAAGTTSAPAAIGVTGASAVPRSAPAIPAVPSRRAPAAPTTVAAVFIASAAKERKNRRRASRFASSGSAGSAGSGAAGWDAPSRSSVMTRPRPGPCQ